MNIIASTATFSPCRTWRHKLTREFDCGNGTMIGIGLNPSTADENINDATITRLLKLSQREGYRSFTMLNLFAYRSPYPRDMKRQLDPVGIGNNAAILETCKQASLILACWGGDGDYMQRSAAVEKLLQSIGKSLYCIGVNGDGSPKHPLYSRSDVEIVPYHSKEGVAL